MATTFTLTVDQVVRRAFQVAGLLHASQQVEPDDAAMARDLLQMELDTLQAEGKVTRTYAPLSVLVAASTATVALPTTTDVDVGPDNVAGTQYPSANPAGETRVYMMSRAEYQGISNKSTTGTPTRVYIERAGDFVNLYFHPVPAETIYFSYQSSRYTYDATGNSAPDADRKRFKSLVWTLAYDLAVAKSVPIERAREIRAERDRLKTVARMDDVERGHGQFVVG